MHNDNDHNNKLVGGFNPLKNKSQLGLLIPIYEHIKHVPNHQPDIFLYTLSMYLTV